MPETNREKEYRFFVPDTAADSLRNLFLSFSEYQDEFSRNTGQSCILEESLHNQDIRDVYYDVKEALLLGRNLYRYRTKNNRHSLDFKKEKNTMPEGSFDREEISNPISGLDFLKNIRVYSPFHPEIKANARDRAVKEIRNVLGANFLRDIALDELRQEALVVENNRKTILLKIGSNTKIEWALDELFYVRGLTRIHYIEFEMEYQSGTQINYHTFAGIAREYFGLIPLNHNKYEIGRGLVAGLTLNRFLEEPQMSTETLVHLIRAS